MRDTRKLREMIGLFVVGGVTAVIGAIYLRPGVKNLVGVKLP